MDRFLRDDHSDVSKLGQARSNFIPGNICNPTSKNISVFSPQFVMNFIDDDAEKFKDDEPPTMRYNGRDFTMKVQRRDGNMVHLGLRIEDAKGNVRNIHFPFDTNVDTSNAVAREMVKELELINEDMPAIVEMIDAGVHSSTATKGLLQ